jgi:uncharacterized protein with PQ loop repeat
MINPYRYLQASKATPNLDRAMLAVCILHPLTALPQVYTIYHNQAAQDVSLATWLGFMLFGVVFLLYSIAHNVKPMIVNQILWFVIDLAVVIGVLNYG